MFEKVLNTILWVLGFSNFVLLDSRSLLFTKIHLPLLAEKTSDQILEITQREVCQNTCFL